MAVGHPPDPNSKKPTSFCCAKGISKPSIQAIGASVFVVAMEVPTRRQQQVAAAHAHRVSVHHQPYALALHDKSERVPANGGVRGRLMRAEVLDGSPQGRRHIGVAAKAGIGESDGAAFAAPSDRDQFAGLRRAQ